MTRHPPVVKNVYQTLLDQATSLENTLRRPMTMEDVARITASSLRLEGFEVTAEELKDQHGVSGS